MSFASILEGLVSRNVSFVVVGGVAASAHGATRVTSDLDICYDAEDRSNVRILAELLAGWRAYPRGVEQGLSFIMDAPTMRGAPVLTLETSEGDLDVLDRIAGVGAYDAVLRNSEEVVAFGLAFRVIDLPSLIKAKRAAGRPRDFEHLPELLALLQLRDRRAGPEDGRDALLARAPRDLNR